MLLLGLVLCWVLFFISLKSYACVFTESCNLGFFVHSNIFVLDVTKNFGKSGGGGVNREKLRGGY